MLDKFGLEPSNSNELSNEHALTWVQQIQAIENAPRDVQAEVVKLILPELTASITTFYSNVQALRELLFIISGLTLSRGEILKAALRGSTGNLFRELANVQESYILLRRKAGEKRFDDIQPSIDAYADLVKRVVTGIQRLLQDEDRGESLRQVAATIIPTLADLHQTSQERVGGTPRSAVLDLLYDLALPYFNAEKNEWGRIATQVWKELHLKPQNEMSPTEHELYKRWAELDHRKRKQDIRYVFQRR